MYNYIKKPKKANKNNLYLRIERLSKIGKFLFLKNPYK